jgi:putative ABC transport system substrate-binding protein
MLEDSPMRLSALGFLVTLALSLLVVPLAAAPPLAKVPRIGVLWDGSPTAAGFTNRINAFQQGLRDLGDVEGQNFAMEVRFTEGQSDSMPALAAELVQLPVDVIVVSGADPLRAAKEATSTIPIVMIGGTFPVAPGYIASFARPGGTITGLTHLTPELSGKRLELLKEAIPGLSRVAVLWNGDSPAMGLAFGETQVAARALGVQIQPLQVRQPADFESAFEAALSERTDALITFGDPLTNTHRRRIMEFAAQSRLPTMYTSREFVDAGGLMSYGPNVPEMWRRGASYVDKILKGVKPAELPVEQPMRFELVINLKVAQALGFTIPPTLLFQADEVIR